jgi:hypothetical protein
VDLVGLNHLCLPWGREDPPCRGNLVGPSPQEYQTILADPENFKHSLFRILLGNKLQVFKKFLMRYVRSCNCMKWRFPHQPISSVEIKIACAIVRTASYFLNVKFFATLIWFAAAADISFYSYMSVRLQSKDQG